MAPLQINRYRYFGARASVFSITFNGILRIIRGICAYEDRCLRYDRVIGVGRLQTWTTRQQRQIRDIS